MLLPLSRMFPLPTGPSSLESLDLLVPGRWPHGSFAFPFNCFSFSRFGERRSPPPQVFPGFSVAFSNLCRPSCLAPPPPLFLVIFSSYQPFPLFSSFYNWEEELHSHSVSFVEVFPIFQIRLSLARHSRFAPAFTFGSQRLPISPPPV